MRIDGRLGAHEANELLIACAAADQPLRLCLSGLRSLDDEGVRALQSLRADGVELVGASDYVEQLLNAHTTASKGAANK